VVKLFIIFGGKSLWHIHMMVGLCIREMYYLKVDGTKQFISSVKENQRVVALVINPIIWLLALTRELVFHILKRNKEYL